MDDKLSAAILKTVITAVAETRALRDVIMMINGDSSVAGVTTLLSHYNKVAASNAKQILENLYAEYGAVPDEVKAILNG